MLESYLRSFTLELDVVARFIGLDEPRNYILEYSRKEV
jgi:hypothetical protein